MGMLLRLILLCAVAWIVFRLLQRALGLPAPGQGTAPSEPAPATMRRCAWCSVHTPESESTQSRGHFFCCEAHRDAFLRAPKK
jgi:uncharacterized protein